MLQKIITKQLLACGVCVAYGPMELYISHLAAAHSIHKIEPVNLNGPSHGWVLWWLQPRY